MVIDARHRLATVKQLPYDAEIEYLESTGTQWIDTGVVPLQTMKLEFSFSLTNIPTDTFAMGFGVDGVPGTAVNHEYFVFGLFLNNTANVQAQVGKATSGANIISDLPVMAGFTYNGILEFNKMELNGKLYVPSVLNSYVDFTRPLWLFTSNSLSFNSRRIVKARFYAFRIYNDFVLIRDFIPVRIGTTGYMYDRANPKGGPLGNGLYPNQGSGDFILGNDVAYPKRKFEITYRKPFVSITPPTARDYTQDGLIALWDGIENAGWGTHDNQNRLVNLKGNASFTISSMGEDYAVVSVANSLYLGINTVKSGEIVCSVFSNGTGGDSDNGLLTTTITGSTQYTGSYNYGGLRFGSTVRHKSNVVMGVTSANYVIEDMFNAANYNERFHSAICFKDLSSDVYLNGQLKNTSSIYLSNPKFFQVLGLYNAANRGLNGQLCCIRLYSRALTAEEIAHNYRIDKIRFNLP